MSRRDRFDSGPDLGALLGLLLSFALTPAVVSLAVWIWGLPW